MRKDGGTKISRDRTWEKERGKKRQKKKNMWEAMGVLKAESQLTGEKKGIWGRKEKEERQREGVEGGEEDKGYVYRAGWEIILDWVNFPTPRKRGERGFRNEENRKVTKCKEGLVNSWEGNSTRKAKWGGKAVSAKTRRNGARRFSTIDGNAENPSG